MSRQTEFNDLLGKALVFPNRIDLRPLSEERRQRLGIMRRSELEKLKIHENLSIDSQCDLRFHNFFETVVIDCKSRAFYRLAASHSFQVECARR
jgi:hypothetical protein